MGAVTYPEPSVAAIVQEHYIPLQLNIKDVPQLVQRYRALWTPQFNVLNSQGEVAYRVEGWLPPSEFAPMLLEALGYYRFMEKRYSQALEPFQEVLNRFPRSEYAPEALYYTGVSKYMDSGNAEDLLGDWQRLQTMHPQSLWAVRTQIP